MVGYLILIILVLWYYLRILNKPKHAVKVYVEPNTTKKLWKTEEECRSIFEKVFKKTFASVRHPEIINPKTGRRLELDGYSQDLKVAFEFNGEHHYKYPNFFHLTLTEYQEQLYRDNIKKIRCKELGIYLIVIPFTQRNNLESFILCELKKIDKLPV